MGWIFRSAPAWVSLYLARQWLHKTSEKPDLALLKIQRPVCGDKCNWLGDESVKSEVYGVLANPEGVFEDKPYTFKSFQPEAVVEDAVGRVVKWVDGDEAAGPLVMAFAGPAGTGKR